MHRKLAKVASATTPIAAQEGGQEGGGVGCEPRVVPIEGPRPRPQLCLAVKNNAPRPQILGRLGEEMDLCRESILRPPSTTAPTSSGGSGDDGLVTSDARLRSLLFGSLERERERLAGRYADDARRIFGSKVIDSCERHGRGARLLSQPRMRSRPSPFHGQKSAEKFTPFPLPLLLPNNTTHPHSNVFRYPRSSGYR